MSNLSIHFWNKKIEITTSQEMNYGTNKQAFILSKEEALELTSKINEWFSSEHSDFSSSECMIEKESKF